MKTEMRLKKILVQKKLDGHGICLRIAHEAQIHRHTVSKIYHNANIKSISFPVLERLCGWLHRTADVPKEQLPGLLFGSEPSGLLKAIAALGHATIYMGEYRQAETPMRWIALRDAMVHTEIVRELSSYSAGNTYSVEIQTRYVPFSFTTKNREIKEGDLQKDTRAAKRIFAEALGPESKEDKSASILLGSQRVNYLVELLVATLFGCDPFKSPDEQKRLPFYTTYREFDRVVPSCFGGRTPPADYQGEGLPGIYYRDKTGQWAVHHWKDKTQDSGIVITIYDPGTQILQMAVFGLSGRCTSALGSQLFLRECFWPPYAKTKGKLVGIYMCQSEFSDQDTATESEGLMQNTKFDVIPLSREILLRYLP